MQLRVLSRRDLQPLVSMPAAIRAVRSAFEQLSGGQARIPVRTPVEAPESTLLVMPGFLPEPGVAGAKLVSVAPGNKALGLPTVHAAVLLVEARTGRPTALLEGGWLTAVRTGAASGLATDLLALPGADVLAVVGAGVQARTQIEAVRAVRPIRAIRLTSRTRASAARLADELTGVTVSVHGTAAEALEGARVVVTATDSATPVVADGEVEEGTHVNAVGSFTPAMRELPEELLARARVVVDQVEAARAEAGEIIHALRLGALALEDLVELGAVARSGSPGRHSPGEITVFKSVGSAAQDLAVAAMAVTLAEAAGAGTLVEF